MSLSMTTNQESPPISDDKNDKVRHHSTYVSFGDEGVTATANSHGHLLQMTRYFGNEVPRFFCVDLIDTPPPSSITDRMQKIQDYLREFDVGMKLHIEHPGDVDPHIWKANTETPTLDFVHDRWPRFVTATPKFNLSIQYLISEKTVYQIYNFKFRQREDFTKLPLLALNAMSQLRHLDSITAGDDHENYSDHLSTDKNYIIRTRTICQTAQNNQKTIALVITPVVNKRHQQLKHRPEIGDYQIILDEGALHPLKQEGTLEVILAYRLELISSSEIAHMSLISTEPVTTAQGLLEIPFETPVFSLDKDLNFNMRRNLEHILSVCSIPLSFDVDGNNPSIALTCGDVSGHRVSATASFVYQSENAFREDGYASRMRFRIHRICRGHLKWLSENLKLDQGSFSLSYRASSTPITNHDNNPNSLKQSLIDIALHIIKAADFHRAALADENTKLDIVNGFRPIVKDWITILDAKNKGRHFTFPNLREEMDQWIFDLSDHAVIWWAIKSAEELKLGAELRADKIPGTNICRDSVSYSSKMVRESILKRFTIENSLFEKRMIAISRSSNETRHCSFFAMELGLFDHDALTNDESDIWRNKFEAWGCTVDYQKECEDDQNANWDWHQPLHFALALIMSSKNKRINSRMILEIQRDAKKVLLQSSSSNGLFPGLLDENKGPALFDHEDMRDPFWSATFELPYILLKYSTPQLLREDPGLSDTASTPSLQLTSTSIPAVPTVPTTPDSTQELLNNGNLPISSSGTLTRWESPFMKHGVLFTHAIDRDKIVEIPDEWLYREPKFFAFHTTVSPSAVDEFCEKARKTHLDETSTYMDSISTTNTKLPSKETGNRKFLARNSKAASRRIYTGICTMKVLHEAAMEVDYQMREGQPMGHIIDVPRAGRYKKTNEFNSTQITSSDSLLNHINEKRTPIIAKKRIFQFCRTSWNIALMCYLASSEAEEISCFFDRHASMSPYFFEDTIGTLNKWVTELHLPFYQLLPPEESSRFIRNVLQPEGRPTITEPKVIQFPQSNLKGAQKSLIRAVISFRFDGDLLDRYWTCHLIEHRPQQRGSSKEMFNITTQPISGALKSNPWRQRRILELLLFDRMLQEILRCTEEILKEAKGTLRASKGVGHGDWGYESAESESKYSDMQSQNNKAGRDFFLSNNSLYKIQEVLQEVEDDLNENLAKMQLWKSRQDGRGLDKPRWTLKDEYRYGGAISRLQASNDFYMEELVRCRAKILAFNLQITRDIDAARSDWEMRTTNDVRLFTYVTVVFLPTSFATGVFSMSKTPSRHMLFSMMVTAVVALLVTTIALVNAKTLNGMLRYIKDSIRQVLYRLTHLTDGSYQSAVDRILLIYSTIFELIFSVVGGILYCLDKCHKLASKYFTLTQQVKSSFTSSGSHQGLLYYSIYLLARYIFYPVERILLRITPDAELKTPVDNLHLDDAHPIKQAQGDFKKACSAAKQVKSNPEEESFGSLFDDLGQRNSGNLFKIWQERLKLWQEKLEQERLRQKEIIVVSEVGSKSGSS
ncbi:hypothetical protein M431DRAFT_555750 [Trichoderma harzianum CBS 226.95]|uniref:Uncharacterized protein n=1 Tax=Trichoderma harzianum CBS 226.95 TaxID=983964 RepID=A0A2T4ABN4_TRIHA|nr:hypothetical protein M431DRAFT_555750 [Trichoderma harzianum CBS 226.95]PTB54328.1 hypothetical protein M431DRAFT_555750 [Trichoderma harzianum CBS 226.95]